MCFNISLDYQMYQLTSLLVLLAISLTVADLGSRFIGGVYGAETAEGSNGGEADGHESTRFTDSRVMLVLTAGVGEICELFPGFFIFQALLSARWSVG